MVEASGLKLVEMCVIDFGHQINKLHQAEIVCQLLVLQNILVKTYLGRKLERDPDVLP